jgi:hypothetical protein
MPRIACALLTLLLLLPQSASAEAIIRARLEAYDAANQPITSIEVGQAFVLRAYVEDLRDPHVGVAGANLATSFDPAIVSPNGPLQVTDFFTDFQPLSFVGPSTLVGGGFALVVDPEDLPAPGGQLLFTVPMFAARMGTAVFTPGLVTGEDFEWFVFLSDSPVLSEQIELVGLQLNVVPEPSSIVLSGIGAAAIGLVAFRRYRR